MPHLTASGALLILGGAIFGALGSLHAIFTLQDIGRPRRIVPDDPAVIAAMERSHVRLTRGASTMWSAWVGFNLSHSLGAVLFSAVTIALGVWLPDLSPPANLLLLPVGVGALYLMLAVKFWFRTPVIGTGLGTGCFVLAWLLH